MTPTHTSRPGSIRGELQVEWTFWPTNAYGVAGDLAANRFLSRSSPTKQDAAMFSQWVSWNRRADLGGLHLPGVYLLRVTDGDVDGSRFRWTDDIAYVGMTRSKGGLRSRLQQFDNTIKGKEGHGGARRFRRKYRDYRNLVAKLYVSVRSFECDVTAARPEDLRTMGEVVQFEYECLADFVQCFGQLPEFNDRKRSPKD